MGQIFNMMKTTVAKTGTGITILIHGSTVYHVLKFLLGNTKADEEVRNRLLVAALVHDVGKLEKDMRKNRWVHTPHTRKFLGALIKEKEFQSFISELNLQIPDDFKLLVKLCEEHHAPGTQLLLGDKHHGLLCLADLVASALENGVTGSIESIAEATWPMAVQTLIKATGVLNDNILKGELHRIDLPSRDMRDMLAAGIVFQFLETKGFEILFQRGSTLWIYGNAENVVNAVLGLRVAVSEVYERTLKERVMEEFIENRAVTAKQPASYKPLLFNEQNRVLIAKKYLDMKGIRDACDRFGIDIASYQQEISGQPEEILEELYLDIRSNLQPHLKSELPRSLKEIEENNLIPENFENFFEPQEDWNHAKRLLDLYYRDGKRMGGKRSLLSLWMLHRQDFTLDVERYALVDGLPLQDPVLSTNPCPVCHMFPTEYKAYSLLVGGAKQDSSYYTREMKHPKNELIKVCGWCYFKGYIDLPVVTLKFKRRLDREYEYLYFTTPLRREKINSLLDYLRKDRTSDETVEEYNERLKQLARELIENMGCDPTPLLGFVGNRLGERPKGFIIPSINDVEHTCVLKIPFHAMHNLSTAWKKLTNFWVKTYMSKLFRSIPVCSMHYMGVNPECNFSVFGEAVSLNEMERAELAWTLIEKFGRQRTTRGLRWRFELLNLVERHPREAAERILLYLKRAWSGKQGKRGPRGVPMPKRANVQEVIELSEEIVKRKEKENEEWLFDWGLRTTDLLIRMGLSKRTGGFYKPKSEDYGLYTHTDLTKWMYKIKSRKTPNELRIWADQVLLAVRRETKGTEIRTGGEKQVQLLVNLVEELIQECEKHDISIGKATRKLARTANYMIFKIGGKEVKKPE